MGCAISSAAVHSTTSSLSKQPLVLSANVNAGTLPICNGSQQKADDQQQQSNAERRKSRAIDSCDGLVDNAQNGTFSVGAKPIQRNSSNGTTAKSNTSSSTLCSPIRSIGKRERFCHPSSAKEALLRLLCSREREDASSSDSDSDCDFNRRHSNSNMMFPTTPPSSASKRTPSSRARTLMHKFSIDTSRAKSNAPVVSFCAKKLGIREFPEPREDGQHCDIYWHSVCYPDMKAVVGAGSRVNKFPGMTELAKKIALTQAIRSMRQLFPAEYAFYPESWILPAQLEEFRHYCASNASEEHCFIVKPDDGAQGTGIYLVNSPNELQSLEGRQLVQEYVPDPYLLPDQLKFDLRVYAVVKSINPLSIYVAREGMARFCTEKYPGKPNRDNFGNLYAHLTNYSLNKVNNAYVHSKSLKEQLKGSKRLLSTVFHQMEHKGVRTRRLWKAIKLIIVKTVLAMVPEMMLSYEREFCCFKGQAPQCFQIMGFDILVRNDGTPVLLEVNSSPSLSVEHNLMQAEAGKEVVPQAQTINLATEDPSIPPVRSIVDEMIKVPLVRDSILLVLDQLDQFYPVNSTKERPMSRKTKGSGGKWEIQSLDSVATSSAICSALPFGKATAEDDFGLLRRARRPHLSEVFPARYGQTSRHLLVLDRAVYLYLQFVSNKQTMLISLPTIRAFLRKCELSNFLPSNALDKKFNEINAYFSFVATKTVASGASALPFHGFLQILFHLAKVKFGSPAGGDLLPQFINLLSHCDCALRRYGVRSTRLRRAEFLDEQQQDENDGIGGECKQRSPMVKIYLLPSRIPRQPLQPAKEANGSKRRIAPEIRAKSLPRKLVIEKKI